MHQPNMSYKILENNDKGRDRHILKNDLKKWGAGDPLNFSNFFAKIVFLVLLYKTVTKFLCKSTNFGYF